MNNLKGYQLFFQRWWIVVAVGLLAILVRTIGLGQYPAGLHFDEAWIGYNSFLLKEKGMNIYGEKWPVDIDFFGEHVSAAHSYFLVPFISILGLNPIGIRSATVFFSLATFGLSTLFVYRLTKRREIASVFAILFALSPLNIVMSRASSTVIIDAFWLTAYFFGLYEWLSHAHRLRRKWFWAGLVGLYLLSVTAYLTYFSSRLLIPAVSILTLWYFFRQKIKLKFLVAAALPLFVYLIIPFFILLPTPFGRGRFDQTTVINNQTVRFDLTNNSLRMGQAGWPILPTRALHNKISENVRALSQQYLTFFAPNVSLFSIENPLRYRMPGLGAIAPVEYFGFLVALAVVLLPGKFKDERNKAALLVLLTLAAFVPTALTVDDFPNWQRAAIITPFWQLAAALGLTVFADQFGRWKKFLPVGVLVLSLPIVVFLSENYTAQARYFEPFHRDVAGWQVGEWIDRQPESTPLLAPSLGTFIYPYLQSQQIIPELSVEKEGKYFLLEPQFRIGSRLFVRDLCLSPLVLTEDYNFLILFKDKQCHRLPWWFEQVETISWEDGTSAYYIGRPQVEIQKRLKEVWGKLKTDQQRQLFLQNVFSEQQSSTFSF